MYIRIVILLLLIALIYTFSGPNLISASKAQSMIETGKINAVVDVRTNKEYKAGHYPGSINIPVNEINEITTSSLPISGILVYCNTGQRARYASRKLEKLGFTRVYYIAGPYTTLM